MPARRIDFGTWPHLTAALAIFALFLVWVLPHQVTETARYTQLALPDLRFFYTPDQLAAVLDSLGTEGRAAYVRSRYVFDVVWPVAYTYLNVCLLARFVPRATGPDHVLRRHWFKLALAPFFVDMLENTFTGIAAARFPDVPVAIAWAATSFTAVKWTCVGATSLAVVVTGVLAAVRRAKPEASA